MPVVHVTSAEDFTSFISSKTHKATIVDFTASWCGPCQMIKPVFEELSKQYTTVQFLKVDVDELSDVSGNAGVRAMPTFQIYKDGSKVEEMVGASKDKLTALVQKYA